jgi:hypothetical protein
MMSKKHKGKIYILLYINVQEFNIWKYNLKINMHPRLCMHEHFDLFTHSKINVKH